MAGMRGVDNRQSSMFCVMSPESRVPQDHPLRAIKKMCEAVLEELSPTFDATYSPDERDSVPPGRLLRALEPSFHHSAFSKNRQRLSADDVAKLFFVLVVEQARA
jgi:transposase